MEDIVSVVHRTLNYSRYNQDSITSAAHLTLWLVVGEEVHFDDLKGKYYLPEVTEFRECFVMGYNENKNQYTMTPAKGVVHISLPRAEGLNGELESLHPLGTLIRVTGYFRVVFDNTTLITSFSLFPRGSEYGGAIRGLFASVYDTNNLTDVEFSRYRDMLYNPLKGVHVSSRLRTLKGGNLFDLKGVSLFEGSPLLPWLNVELGARPVWYHGMFEASKHRCIYIDFKSSCSFTSEVLDYISTLEREGLCVVLDEYEFLELRDSNPSLGDPQSYSWYIIRSRNYHGDFPILTFKDEEDIRIDLGGGIYGL